MTDDRAKLLAQLEQIFPAEVLQERAAPHKQCLECDEITTALANRTWLEIPSEFVAGNPDILPLLSEPAYVTYLPAWLREGLLHPDGGVAGMLAVNLADHPRIGGFTAKQAAFVVTTVKAMFAASIWGDDPECEASMRAIEQAWLSRPTDPEAPAG